ncbi:MAG: CvpA family protein [Verrucomicrobiales bacterium]|nr:CvpA family protein [Verrucomicrobiales bacterium]
MEIGGYQFSLGTLALVLLVGFLLWGFVKGVAKLVLSAGCLAVGAWVGYLVFMNGSEWLEPVTGKPPGGKTVLYAAWGSGVFASGAVALVVRRLFSKFTGSGKGRGPVGFVGALLSLVPGAFFIWVGAMFLRTSGLVSELEGTDRAAMAEDGEVVDRGGILEGARRALDDSWFAGLLRWTDPVASDREAKLARLLLLLKDPEAWEALRNDGAVARLLEEPAMQRLVQDNDVLADLAHSDYTRLLKREEVAEAAQTPEVVAKLEELDVEAALDGALYEAVPLVGADSRVIEEETAEESVFTRTRKRRRGVKRGAY